MIKKIIKQIIPKPLRQELVLLRKKTRYSIRKHILRLALKGNAPLKIIVGAAETHQSGWLATNEQWLDITNERHWKQFFGNENRISHVVAEHVFEHLTNEEASRALNYMFERLTKNGRIRIAVPDGYNPNKEYIKHVEIAGIGDDASDHKQLLNLDTLTRLIEQAGFAAQHVEGFTKEGELVQVSWSSEDGFIRRSRQNNTQEKWQFPDAATSLIIDGIKNDKGNIVGKHISQ